MRFTQHFAWGGALAALAAFAGPSHAAWNNVFQVCCNSCGTPAAPTVAMYTDPAPSSCPPPCPTTSCTTRYVQRSCYQPVTTYKTTTYYQPVTSYRTSYYYEPVTSYRYSCYYDPCTCRYQSVATPTTSYCLKSRCCPVTSYLQRTCVTPVQSYQQSFYYEPVTTCCTTSTVAAVAAPPPGASVTPGTPAPPPATGETREPEGALPGPPPGTTETRDAGRSRSDKPPHGDPAPFMPGAASGGAAPRRVPAARPDRIASQANARLEGKVLDASRAPRSGVRVLLVSVDSRDVQQTVTADRDGEFRVRVRTGGWLVYTFDDGGRPVFSRRVEVPADRPVSMTLVQR